MELRRNNVAAWLGALAAVLLLGLAVAYLPQIVRFRMFRMERDRTEALLESIRTPTPQGIDPVKWDDVWMTVYNGFGNVCFTEREVSIVEMRRLRKDLELLLRTSPRDLKTLERIWERLGETGPHGAEYTQGKRPLLDEAINY